MWRTGTKIPLKVWQGGKLAAMAPDNNGYIVELMGLQIGQDEKE